MQTKYDSDSREGNAVHQNADIFLKSELMQKLDLLNQGRLQYIINNLRDSFKELNVQHGQILNLSDENYRVSVSPYRVTMELRFPEGITNI
ncbi:MAG: hypothetical protein P8X42_15005 [Calditrichaceae bacterium]|jgi:hypothetical protein